jgi:hypothetical protein
MTQYTFEADIFSDLYKETYGIRPRHHAFYDENTTDAERQEMWDYTCKALDQAVIEREAEKQAHLAEFKALVQETIAMGAKDEETALRWLLQGEDFYSGQCVEHWVWNQGILFTEYGRKLVERLLDLVDYKPMETI